MKKEKIGFVIESNENSAKVKIDDIKKYEFYFNFYKNNNNIINANNNIGAKRGQKVFIEFSIIKTIKLMYIYYLQPIIFIFLGMLIGNAVELSLNQENLIYKVIFGCILFTISIIYKDYYKEKNKISKKDNPNIIKIISK